MKFLKDTYHLYIRKITETKRNPVFMSMGLIMPLLYLILFAPLLKNFASIFPTQNVIDSFVPGMLVMISFFGGLFSGYGIIDELRSGVIERFRVAPISRFAILLSLVLKDMTEAIFVILVFIILSIFFGFHINILGLLALLTLSSLVTISTSAFSNAIGLIFKSEDKLSPIVQGVNLPILLLSGMLLPMTFAPNWLLKLAHFDPLYYVVEASRYLSSGNIMNVTVGIAFGIMTGLTAILMYWASKEFSKAVY